MRTARGRSWFAARPARWNRWSRDHAVATWRSARHARPAGGAVWLFVIGIGQRQHRLARQQMEFVAAVSHELRTPLAVICSAGENLADGVVNDSEQVKTYGSLIRTEGRRLADMVERVMEFAGITRRRRCELATMSTSLASSATRQGGRAGRARARRSRQPCTPNAALPPVVGDADALRVRGAERRSGTP